MWLSSKAEALGSEHKIESLNGILATPLLSTWKNRAQNLKKYQYYWQYKHDVTVKSAEVAKDNVNRAIVKASVREIANLYQNGRLNASRSYDDRLNVHYELIREQDRWLIYSPKLID